MSRRNYLYLNTKQRLLTTHFEFIGRERYVTPLLLFPYAVSPRLGFAAGHWALTRSYPLLVQS